MTSITPTAQNTARLPTVVGFSGSHHCPSHTGLVVQQVLDVIAARAIGRTRHFDLTEVSATLGSVTDRSKADARLNEVLCAIESADALVVGTPVYKGAYTGLFKHLFDLFDMTALARKPVVLTATGKSPAHASVIDYHLRPLFLFFDADVASRGLYALPGDFINLEAMTQDFLLRVGRVVDELECKLAVSRITN